MPYFDAVKRWNLGGTSWCLPRKGTPGYETVMAIRRGEPAKTREETVAEIVKGEPKPKKRIRVKQNISLVRQEEMESVKLPTVEEHTAGKKKMRLPKKKEVKAFEHGYKDKYRTDKFEEALEKYKDTNIEPALRDYQAYITEINKTRKTPVKTVHILVTDEQAPNRRIKEQGGTQVVFSTRKPLENPKTWVHYEQPGVAYLIRPKFVADIDGYKMKIDTPK